MISLQRQIQDFDKSHESEQTEGLTQVYVSENKTHAYSFTNTPTPLSLLDLPMPTFVFQGKNDITGILPFSFCFSWQFKKI